MKFNNELTYSSFLRQFILYSPDNLYILALIIEKHNPSHNK